MKISVGEYKTKCGFAARVFISQSGHFSESSNHGQAIGAVLIPVHPAAFPGWQECQWDAETGKCLSRNDSDVWDLILT